MARVSCGLLLLILLGVTATRAQPEPSHADKPNRPLIHTRLGAADYHRPTCARLGEDIVVPIEDAKMGDRVAMRPALAGDLYPCPICTPQNDEDYASPPYWRGAVLLTSTNLREEDSPTAPVVRVLSRSTTVRVLRKGSPRQFVEVIDLTDSAADGDRGWITTASARHEVVIDFLNEARRARDILAAKWPPAITAAALSGDVLIGMTLPQVIATLGKPKDITTDRSALGSLTRLDYRARWVLLQNGRVISVTDF